MSSIAESRKMDRSFPKGNVRESTLICSKDAHDPGNVSINPISDVVNFPHVLLLSRMIQRCRKAFYHRSSKIVFLVGCSTILLSSLRRRKRKRAFLRAGENGCEPNPVFLMPKSKTESSKYLHLQLLKPSRS